MLAYACYGLMEDGEKSRPVIVGGIMLIAVVSSALEEISRDLDSAAQPKK